MRVLVLMGSLRKKNTLKAVERFERLHKSHRADCRYDYIYLNELNLQLCRGCGLCLSLGEGRCPLKDDLPMVVHKMEESDVVILASPNYVMNVNWLTKNFIDRMAYNLHRPKFFNQRFVLLVTSGNFMGAKEALKALSSLVSGGKAIGKLVVYTAPELSQKKQIRQNKVFAQKADRIIQSLDKPHVHKPTLGMLMWFSSFKASHEVSKDSMPADYDYYRDKDYFINHKLNLLQKGIIKTTSALMKRVMS